MWLQIPCAVCENVGALSTFISFGRDVCPTGYRPDYRGYVFSSHRDSSNRKSEFVCIDRQPDTYDNGKGNHNDNHGRLYPISYQVIVLCPKI